MAKRKELSEDVKKIIIDQCRKGKKVSEIAKILNISWSTVKYVINTWKSTGTVSYKSRCGRPRKTTTRTDRKIVNTVLKDRRISLPKLGSKLRNELKINVSDFTIRRRLKEAKLNGRVAKKKPFLTKRHISKRKEWARKHLSWDDKQWAKVLWSDESKFCLFGNKGIQRVWRRPNESLRMDCVKPTVKFGGGKIIYIHFIR